MDKTLKFGQYISLKASYQSSNNEINWGFLSTFGHINKNL